MNDRYIPRERNEGWRRFELSTLAAGRRARAQETPKPPPAESAKRLAEEEGLRRGLAAGEARIAAEAARLASLVTTLRSSLDTLEEDLAETLLDLAVAIARQVLRSDVTLRREALLPVIREAMQALPDNVQHPQLLLNPADAEVVRSRIGDTLAQGGWSIVEDHRIEPGGCKLSAQNCDIDATLPTRWAKALGALGRSGSWSDG